MASRLRHAIFTFRFAAAIFATTPPGRFLDAAICPPSAAFHNGDSFRHADVALLIFSSMPMYAAARAV